jgi:radical SAM superfamily enzyme YgiQ (UPF0313 family)
MKVTLISPYTDITSFGIRTLSTHIKNHGYATQLIFLPDPFGDDLKIGVQRYQDEILKRVVSLCSHSDLIGISVMTNFFDGAAQITKKLKEHLEIPIIWGGVHPTIRPLESLEHADMVCIGEGEDAFLELLNKMSAGENFLDTSNIWIKSNGEVIKNPLNPLPRDLDIFPFPDYSMDDHYIMVDNRVVPLTHSLTESFLKKGTVAAYLGKTGYQTMTSRGCPYSCAYCINNTIKSMYGGKGKLRMRSVDHVIQELIWVKENMPYVNYIWLSDDEFFARKYDEMIKFSYEFKAKINLPFSCLISPLNITEEKMELLVDAGLIYVQMGVETGSARMQELYNRKKMNNRRLMKAIRIINQFKEKMFPPSYDFLLDVPFETDRDRIDSLRFIADIPKPYRLQPFTLVLYPGTRLYELAIEKGMIADEYKEIYNKTYTMREPSYLNLLMTLSRSGKFPSTLLKLLISPPVVSVLNSNMLKPLFRWVYLGMRGIYHLSRNMVAKPQS